MDCVSLPPGVPLLQLSRSRCPLSCSRAGPRRWTLRPRCWRRAPPRQETLRQRLSVAAGTRDVMAAAAAEVGNPLAVMAALTQALPDDSFLSQLTLNHRQLNIAGESGSAAALLAALSGLSHPDRRDLHGADNPRHRGPQRPVLHPDRRCNRNDRGTADWPRRPRPGSRSSASADGCGLGRDRHGRCSAGMPAGRGRWANGRRWFGGRRR